MHRFLRFSAFCLAAWPAGALAGDWGWQWEDSPAGVFREFRSPLRGGALLPLEPGSPVPSLAVTGISSAGGGGPVRELKPARSFRQDHASAGTASGPEREHPQGGVVHGAGDIHRAGALETTVGSTSTYQGMGMTDGLYAGGSGQAAFSSGNGMVWQFVVPWYGWLIISPGFADPAWDFPLTSVIRPVQPVPLTPSQPWYDTWDGNPFPVLQSPGYVIWLSARQL